MTESLGLFGDLELDEVPDNPFFIENGTYQFVVTKLVWETYEPNDGSGDIYHNSTYTVCVDEPDSPYNGKPVQQRFTRYPDLSRPKFNALPPDQQQKILENASRHKQFLKGLGLNETELSECGRTEDYDRETAVGRLFTAKYSEVKAKDSDRVYKNLNNLKPVEDEPQDSSDMGGFQF